MCFANSYERSKAYNSFEFPLNVNYERDAIDVDYHGAINYIHEGNKWRNRNKISKISTNNKQQFKMHLTSESYHVTTTMGIVFVHRKCNITENNCKNRDSRCRCSIVIL